MELTERKIKAIPFQTLGILCMHLAGIDVRTKMHRNTYYAHKRILKGYGYDLTFKDKDKNRSAQGKTK